MLDQQIEKENGVHTINIYFTRQYFLLKYGQIGILLGIQYIYNKTFAINRCIKPYENRQFKYIYKWAKLSTFQTFSENYLKFVISRMGEGL